MKQWNKGNVKMIMMEFFSRCTKWTIKNLCISDQNFWNHIMCSCDFDYFDKAKEGSQFSCYLELLFYLFVFYFFPFLSLVIPIQNFNHKNTRNINWLLLLIMSESESEVAQLYPTLCNPMDCSLPGSSVHGIFQAIVLEWIAISFSRGSSWPRDRTRVSLIVDRRLTVWATREVLFIYNNE